MVFLCWGSHHEDLTAQVEARIVGASLPVVQTALEGGRRRARPWTVTVTCSEGHVNVFSGDGPADPPTIPVVRVEPDGEAP